MNQFYLILHKTNLIVFGIDYYHQQTLLYCQKLCIKPILNKFSNQGLASLYGGGGAETKIKVIF